MAYSRRWIKPCTLIVILLICLLSVTSIYGSTDHVVDDYEGLSAEEENQLESQILDITNNFALDVVIVITDELDGKTSEAYADDYYDYNGYGTPPDYDGILMLVNMADREVHFSTTGDTIIDRFDPYLDNELYEAVRSYLSDGDFYGASTIFLDMVYVIEANDGLPTSSRTSSSSSSTTSSNYSSNYSSQPTFSSSLWNMVTSPIAFVFALIVSIGTTWIITYSSKGKITTTNRTYEAEGSFVVEHRIDNYINQTTTRQRIQKNNSGGGGGSRHTGSSGRSHGGGGGGF